MRNENSTTRVHIALTQGYEFLATFPDLADASTITVDEAPPLGSGIGPNPAALLAAAVGNCLAASLVFCLRKSRAEIDRISADVSLRMTRNAAGRFRIRDIDVALSPEVATTDLNRLMRCDDLFEDFCIVTQSVRNGIPVNVTVNGTPVGRRDTVSTRTFWESFQVEGESFLDRLRDLIREGNIRRVVIEHEGRTIAEFPLTAGVVGGMLAPVVAAVGAVVALLKDCTIRVEREEAATASEEKAASAVR